MALIKCPECGKSISSFAKCCPNCGCPIFGENNLTRLLFDFTTIPSKHFPICIETCGECYSFEFEDIATPPEYNLIEVKSIKPRFTIATYIEAAGIGNENETRREITVNACTNIRIYFFNFFWQNSIVSPMMRKQNKICLIYCIN